MEEVVISKDVEIEDYFVKLKYAEKDRLHRYRKVEDFGIDEHGRLPMFQPEDTRKGKIMNNRCYKNLKAGSWELIAIKLPNGDIVTTSPKIAKKMKKDTVLTIINADSWEAEKKLEECEKLCKEGKVDSVKSYRVLMSI